MVLNLEIILSFFFTVYELLAITCVCDIFSKGNYNFSSNFWLCKL